jgi:hypothetical protein
MNKLTLKKIRKKLPYNYANIISEELSVSKSSVYKVLTGVYCNYSILKKAIEMANKNQAKFEKLQTKLKSTYEN